MSSRSRTTGKNKKQHPIAEYNNGMRFVGIRIRKMKRLRKSPNGTMRNASISSVDSMFETVPVGSNHHQTRRTGYAMATT